MNALTLLLGAGAAGAGAAMGLRWHDQRAERREWQRLLRTQPAAPPRFDPACLGGEPEPVQRLFRAVLTPGAPLATVAELEVAGEFALTGGSTPQWQPMRARQIVAFPHGFVFTMRLLGRLPLSGSDSAHWTRFGIAGLVPVARRGGDADHARSAFGRLVAEALFWTPAVLLPGPHVRWSAVDASTVRAHVAVGERRQDVDVTLGDDGTPRQVRFERWSDANPEHRFRLQPFGGELDDFRRVDGCRVPFRVNAANRHGEPDEAPFFRAVVTDFRFPRGGAEVSRRAW